MLERLIGVSPLKQRSPVDSLIYEYQRNHFTMSRFLDEDEFLIQLKHSNHNLMEFMHKERRQICKEFIGMLTMKCDHITDSNYKQYIQYPIIILEIMALHISPLMNAFFEDALIEELFGLMFQVLDRQDEIPEPQLANVVKFLQYLMDKNILKVCQYVISHQVLYKCLTHLYSAQITSFIMIMYNPDHSSLVDQNNLQYSKVDVLRTCIQKMNKFNGAEVLNFMLIVHEIMTRYITIDKSNDVMNYLISLDVIQRLFTQLRDSDNIYTSKSSAHILSLISNYYSYSMQNITIVEENSTVNETDYHLQLSRQFELSDFYKCFTMNLSIFTDKLDGVKRGSLGVSTFKLIEITDNLIRISNLQLWKKMQALGFLTKIFKIFFDFPNSNIIHSITEKLVGYILNRTVSDFHPFWAHHMFVEVNILKSFANYINKHRPDGHIIQMINLFNWFYREVKNQGNYPSQILDIQNAFNSRAWNNCWQASLAATEAEKHSLNADAFEKASSLCVVNAQEQTFDELSNREQNKTIFQSTQTNYIEGNSMQSQGDEDGLMDDDEFYNVNDSEIDVPNKVEEVVQKVVVEAVPKQIQKEEETQKHEIKESEMDGKKVNETDHKVNNIVEKGEKVDAIVEAEVKDQAERVKAKIEEIQKPEEKSVEVDQGETISKDNVLMKEPQSTMILKEIEVNRIEINPESKTTTQSKPTQVNEPNDLLTKTPPTQRNLTLDNPMQIQYYGPSVNITMESPKSSPMRWDDAYDDHPRSLKRRSSAMESSLKLKSMGEETTFDYQIISNDQQDRVLVQPNNRILKVDELDSLTKKEVEHVEVKKIPEPEQSFDMNMSMTSTDSSRKVKIVFRQSLNQNPSLRVSRDSSKIQSMYESQTVSLSESMVNSLVSFNSPDERKFRKISDKDRKFISFLKVMNSQKKSNLEDINQEL